MRVKTEGLEEEPQVQMAPLIDCVFLLLIFFLVAATLKKAHRELEVKLPHAAAAIKTKSEPNTLIIEVTSDGQIWLETEPMSKSLLHKKIRQAAQEDPSREVRVDADRATAFQHIVYLMDLLQFEGLNKVAVRTRD